MTADPPPPADVELAELAGGFIHELKNHLGTLALNLQLLAEDFDPPESQRERRALTRVQRLQGECQRLVELANEFLRFARLGELNREPTDLVELIDDLVVFFGPTAQKSMIEIRPYVPADLPAVALDKDLFRQAVLNLMLNAGQAMPDGGELTIQAAAEGDRVRLEFIDTGRGMSPDVLANVFKPFYTTKPGGNGLGLPTTRRIIEAHGGSIEVQSEPDHGTRFTVRLPVAGAA